MEINEIIQQMLARKKIKQAGTMGSGYAPLNIALAKYWGKKNNTLNIPMNDSFSIALPEKGAFTEIAPIDSQNDIVILNGKVTAQDDIFYQRITHFLNYFRTNSHHHFQIKSYINVPISAGLASSACGYASLVFALDDLFNWNLLDQELSIFARLGSGSASRSIWTGFVQWSTGYDPNGMDSYGEPFPYIWEDLRVGLLLLSSQKKSVSSRDGMRHAKKTSPYFSTWTKQNRKAIIGIIKAIQQKDFDAFGQLVESNALAMHATALTSIPPVLYANEATLAAMQTIWKARAEGLPIYFTQDAGPNLKLLFLKETIPAVQKIFPNLDLLTPFKLDNREELILVDEKDRAMDVVDKIAAHQQGLCHRAFSVFVFRDNKAGKREVLLQQRHAEKLHSANLWTNTCCSHPMPGEDIFSAAKRRLSEEMGMATRLYPRGVFHYKASFANGMIENEVDHVLVGYDEGASITPNPNEVQNVKWVEVDALKKELAANPQQYTPWFERALHIALNENYVNLL